MDEGVKKIITELRTVNHLEKAIREANAGLGIKSGSTVTDAPSGQQIWETFDRDYDTNSSGVFNAIGRAAARYEAEQQIKHAILECYRELSRKQTMLIQEQQKLLQEVETVINARIVDRQTRKEKMETLLKKSAELAEIVTRIQTVKKGVTQR